jgi:hypothetical protein
MFHSRTWGGVEPRFRRIVTTSFLVLCPRILYIIGSDVLTALIMKRTISWDKTPCSPFKVNRRFGGTYRLPLQNRRISRSWKQRESSWQGEPPVFTLVSYSAYSSILKMEAIYSSEKSVDFKRTTRRYILKHILYFISYIYWDFLFCYL